LWTPHCRFGLFLPPVQARNMKATGTTNPTRVLVGGSGGGRFCVEGMGLAVLRKRRLGRVTHSQNFRFGSSLPPLIGRTATKVPPKMPRDYTMCRKVCLVGRLPRRGTNQISQLCHPPERTNTGPPISKDLNADVARPHARWLCTPHVRHCLYTRLTSVPKCSASAGLD
jgi:hypothetical protein